ncbi:MAG: hypothetical protein EXS00_06925 [Phycisphaerales bacterium]|nr:hypothetical protein [Phycisphaerales bacterium]
MSVAAGALAVGISSLAYAGFTNPLIPAWRGLPGTSMVGWESFTSASGGPNLPNFPGSGPSAALFNFGSGAMITSTGNMYGFAGALFINAFGGTLDQLTPQQAVLNVSTAGTTLSLSSVSLTLSDNAGHMAAVSPDSYELRWESAPPDGQGVAQNLAFVWDINDIGFSATNWKLSFASMGASMSLDAATLDLNYVPAPGVLAFIGIATFGRVRRRD